MSTLETIVEDLKSLPAPKLAEVADYVQRLRDSSRGERWTSIEQSTRILTDEDGAELDRIISEGLRGNRSPRLVASCSIRR